MDLRLSSVEPIRQNSRSRV